MKNAVWWVAACLEELFRHSTPAERDRVIVVDDGSTPRSFGELERICARHPGVQLLRNEGRPGFGGACNFGVARATASHVLLLNTDCLITRGTLGKILAAFESDASIGMACPLSNNSPVLTLPLWPGRSYQEMNEMLETAARGKPAGAVAIDACTVVGNCLMISRRCWDETGEFDPMWKSGYGEETDFQMRAMQRGFRGVARIDTYVYHFGSATFRYDPQLAQIQKNALATFLSTWGDAYRQYAARCAAHDPVAAAERALQGVQRKISPDVLFVLPGLAQGVGGVHVVIDLCNYLIRHGIEARCAVLGALNEGDLRAYQEPIYFGLLPFSDEEALLADRTLAPRLVVATLFSTSLPALAYSRMRGIPLLNFVQGYEFYFENGTRRREVEDAYAVADGMMTTSEWLADGIRRHVPDKPLTLLPIGVNEHVFVGREARPEHGKVRVAVMLRSAPDKGQWVLQELLQRLLAHKERVCVTILSTARHAVPAEWSDEPDSVFAALPLDRGAIAALLGECDVLVDASLHEGFGLLPLEAMASGATVVGSDSGGVNQFLRDGVNGLLIREVNKPERYLAAVERLLENRELLVRLRAEAKQTAALFTEDACYARYAAFFRDRLAQPAASSDWSRAAVTLRIDRDAGTDRLAPESQVEVLRPDHLVLRSKGNDPGVLLPSFDAPPGTRLVARIDLVSPAATTLQVFCALADEGVVAKGRRLLRRVLFPGRPRAWRFSEQRSIKVALHRGPNRVLVELPRWQGGRIRVDPGEIEGDFLLRDLEVRALGDAGVVAAGKLAPDSDLPGEACFRLRASAHLKQFEILRQLEVTSSGAVLLRTTGSAPAIRLEGLEGRAGAAMSLWLDIDSPADTVLTVAGESDPASDEHGQWTARRGLRRGRNVLAIELPTAFSRMRLRPGLVPGDYVLHKLEVRSLSSEQRERMTG